MKKGCWEDKINCFRKKSKIKKNITIILVTLSVFFLDFTSKIIIHRNFGIEFNSGLNLINFPAPFPLNLTLSLAYNEGAAFGIFAGYPQVLICARIVVIIALIFYLFYQKNNTLSDLFPALLIIGGALGNVADFFLYGHVIDFIRLGLGKTYFPIFNIADTFITVGSTWFIIKNLKSCKKIF